MRKENDMGVYKITNKVDGKVYVGASAWLYKRRGEHLADLRRNRHGNHKLQLAYNIHGEENFTFEILEYVSDKKYLDEREDYWTKELKSNIDEFGYNMRPIYVNTNLGRKYNEEQKQKISKNRKGKGTGKRNHSPETIKLKSEMCKAQNLSQYHTEEVKEKMRNKIREQHCDVPIPEVQKQAISEHNRGELNKAAKLTNDKVMEILELLKNSKMSIKKIAKLFDVEGSMIYSIKSGKSWRHITKPYIEENGPLRERNSNYKGHPSVAEEQAIEIIKAIEEHTATQKQLAEKYKVSKSTISSIARGVTWTHLPRNKQKDVEDIIEPYFIENNYKIHNDTIMQTNL